MDKNQALGLSYGALKVFIEVVKQEMAKQGLNQVDLAKKMNLSKQTVGQMLTADHSPRHHTMVLLANALGKPLWYLLMEHDERAQWDAFNRPARSLPGATVREKLLAAALALDDRSAKFFLDTIERHLAQSKTDLPLKKKAE